MTKQLGQPTKRKEDFRFITGQGKYTDDLTKPGQGRPSTSRKGITLLLLLTASKSAPIVQVSKRSR